MKKRISLFFALVLCLGGCEQQASGDDLPGDPDTDVDHPPGGDDDLDPVPPDDGLDPEGVRAFPGAEGFGALVTGGRGGQVIKVTTLAATGPGSLQEALDQPGPRIIVFDVSGVIRGNLVIRHGDVTIAGQTAPGAGITIRGRLSGRYDTSVGNIIIRHIRVRPIYDGSDGSQFDAIQLSRNSRVILDHISASFGVDEIIDLYESRDVTVQWSTIESAVEFGHPQGGQHNYGLINGPDGRRISVHHNLFAHNKNRNPAIGHGPADIINNVAYNVRHGFVHHNPARGDFNIIGNYYRKGPIDILWPLYFDGGGPGPRRYYLRDNYYDNPGNACHGPIQNPWSECSQDLVVGPSFRAEHEFDFTGLGELYVPVEVHSSLDAYDMVLERAGAFPRDVVALRSVNEARNRTGSWGARYPEDFMLGLTPTTPPVDSDGDGMPDEWELARGLDPHDPDDHDTVMPSGYTAIEEYINERADALID